MRCRLYVITCTVLLTSMGCTTGMRTDTSTSNLARSKRKNYVVMHITYDRVNPLTMTMVSGPERTTYECYEVYFKDEEVAVQLSSDLTLASADHAPLARVTPKRYEDYSRRTEGTRVEVSKVCRRCDLIQLSPQALKILEARVDDFIKRGKKPKPSSTTPIAIPLEGHGIPAP